MSSPDTPSAAGPKTTKSDIVKKRKPKSPEEKSETPKTEVENSNDSSKEAVPIFEQERIEEEVLNVVLNVENSVLNKCVVYPSHAEIHRNIPLTQTKEGYVDVEIKGISPLIDRDSVRVDLGSSGATLMDVSVVEDVDLKPKNVEIVDVEDIKAEIDLKLTEIARIEKSIEFLEQFVKNNTNALILEKSVDRKLENEAWFSLVNSYQEKGLELEKKAAKARNELKDLRALMLSKKPAALPSKRSYKILLGFYCRSEQVFSFDFIYRLSGATWRSSYDCRVSMQDETVQLSYFAFVQNNTGENWNNTSLVLSTATPSVNGQAPNLGTAKVLFDVPALQKNISFGKAVMSQTFNSLPSRRHDNLSENEMVDNLSDSETEDNFEGGKDSAPEVEQPYLVEFNISRKYTVLSDNKEKKVTVALIPNKDLPSLFSYTTAPCKSLNSYLRCDFRNRSPYVLLPSPVFNVYIDGAFVSCSALKRKTMPSERCTVYLGEDPRIVVSQTPTQTKDSTQSSFGLMKYKAREISTSYTVQNLKNTIVLVNLFDQLPKSEIDTIKVKLISPPENSLVPINNDNEGPQAPDTVSLTEFNNIRWVLKLEPNQKKTISFSYRIEYPQDKTIHVAFS